MKFSVIVPVYNVEKYLPQCVDSILGQSYKDFELILVDDGSPDNCPAICDEYAARDNRIKVIHKKNGGSSDARNAGIKVANGDYILFVDSDDYWNAPDVLKKISDEFEKCCVDIVQFGQTKFYQLDNKLVDGPQRNLSQYNGLSTNNVISQLVERGKLTISACAVAISRNFFVKNELYFKKGLKTEDLEWAIRVFLCNPSWSFIDEYFYVYRMQREKSNTASIDYIHLCDYCWILENSIALVENGDDAVKEPLMSYLMYHMLIASALSYRVKLKKAQHEELLIRLKAICNGRVTKYTLNKKVKLAGLVYRIGGFAVMAKVLGFYLNNRGR